MSWYKTGTVNVTNNSKIVTGVNTKWTNPLIGICSGQMLILQTSNTIEIYEIASVQSDTQLTLAKEYNGASKMGVSYEIPTSPKVSIEALALRVSEMLNYYQIQLDAWQTLLTGDGEVTLTAPDGQIVTIKSQYSIQKELIKLVEQGKVFAQSASESATTATNANSSAKSYSDSAKNSADSASSSAAASCNSAQQSSNSANAAGSSERNAKTSEQKAKKSADDAKKWASTIDTSKLLKTGDYGLGSNVGVPVSDLNEKLPTAFYYTTTEDIADLPFVGGRSSASLLPLPTSSATWGVEMLSVVNSKTPKIFYRCSTSRGKENWYEAITTANIKDFAYQFKGDLVNKSLNELTGTEAGIYFQGRNVQATSENNYPINEAGTLQVFKNGADGAGCCQIYTAYRNARQFIRNYRGGSKSWEPWVEQITSGNSTVDSNGFLKKASPILRLFANDNIEEADGFKKSGCALVNDFASGVTATRIDVGHYEIHGSLGFAEEGWYITLPEDANGNKKFFAEYSVDENNIITVKTYTKKFDFESCQIVAGKPIDITDGRWIDVRLEMPVIEVIENEEPIPSTLNPVIVSEVSDDI